MSTPIQTAVTPYRTASGRRSEAETRTVDASRVAAQDPADEAFGAFCDAIATARPEEQVAYRYVATFSAREGAGANTYASALTDNVNPKVGAAAAAYVRAFNENVPADGRKARGRDHFEQLCAQMRVHPRIDEVTAAATSFVGELERAASSEPRLSGYLEDMRRSGYLMPLRAMALHVPRVFPQDAPVVGAAFNYNWDSFLLQRYDRTAAHELDFHMFDGLQRTLAARAE